MLTQAPLLALLLASCLARPALLSEAPREAPEEELRAAKKGESSAGGEAETPSSSSSSSKKQADSSSSSSSVGGEVVTDADTVGTFNTNKAEGGFSFAPRAPAPEDVEVSVNHASFARLFEELLIGHAIPGSVDIVAEKTGVIQDGSLSDIVIKQASVKETLMVSDPDKEQVIVKVPSLACELSSRYDVRFTQLSIPESGTMNMTLGGGGVRLALPASGAGAGTCHFDAALRMRIHGTSALDGVGGDGVDSALRSVAVAINNNLLSLQDRMLHTIEKSLCSALLASLGDAPAEVHLPVNSAKEDLPAWEAALAEVGLSPLALAAAAALCCSGWCLGACCCGLCTRRNLVNRAETVPLKLPEEDPEAYMANTRGPKSILSSLTCCRRTAPPGWKQDSMM